jgi:hypothetical protein
MPGKGCVRSIKAVPCARDDEMVNILHDSSDKDRLATSRGAAIIYDEPAVLTTFEYSMTQMVLVGQGMMDT